MNRTCWLRWLDICAMYDHWEQQKMTALNSWAHSTLSLVCNSCSASLMCVRNRGNYWTCNVYGSVIMQGDTETPYCWPLLVKELSDISQGSVVTCSRILSNYCYIFTIESDGWSSFREKNEEKVMALFKLIVVNGQFFYAKWYSGLSHATYNLFLLMPTSSSLQGQRGCSVRSPHGPIQGTVESLRLHCVSKKNDTSFACCNFDMCQPISIGFGRNVIERVGSQMIGLIFQPKILLEIIKIHCCMSNL